MDKKWTQDEIDFLTKWYGKKSGKEIAKHLNRTIDSVRRKADRLEITSQKNRIRGKEWTDADIGYIKENYGKKSNTEIARALHRTNRSIQAKAQRMGLTDSEKKQDSTPWTEEEIAYLESKYDKQGVDHIAKKLNRSKTSIKRKANSIGINAYVGENPHVKTFAYCFNCDSRVINRWIDKFGLPCKKIHRGKSTYKTINVKQFWKWAETHKELIPWAKYEPYSLSPEPKWLREIIKEYNAIKANHRTPITHYDKSTVVRMVMKGYTDEEIALELNRTVESVRHIYRDAKEGYSWAIKQSAKS